MRVRKFHPELVREAKWTDSTVGMMHFVQHALLRRFLDGDNWNSVINADPNLLTALMPAVQLIQSDDVFCMYAGALTGFHANPNSKTYLLGRDFFDVFRDTTLENVQFKHLPKNQCGYVEFPYPVKDDDGEEFSGFYFACFHSVSPDNPFPKINVKQDLVSMLDRNMVIIGYQTKNHTFGTLHGSALNTEDGENINIKNDFNKLATKTIWVGPDAGNIKEKSSYTATSALLFNTLVYLNSGQPDLREFQNEFKKISPDSTKIVRADKDLSKLTVTLVGFSFKKESLRVCDGWYSRPHMAWRWYGPGRSQLKWTLIAGSEKQWASKGDECDK